MCGCVCVCVCVCSSINLLTLFGPTESVTLQDDFIQASYGQHHVPFIDPIFHSFPQLRLDNAILSSPLCCNVELLVTKAEWFMCVFVGLCAHVRQS